MCWGLGWPSFGVSARTPEVPDGHHNPVRCPRPVALAFTNTERLTLAGFLAVSTVTRSRKNSWIILQPLAPRTVRAIDLAIGERSEGPIFLAADGRRLDRHGAGRIVRRIARRAGITKTVGPHTLRHAFVTAALDAGVPLRDAQEAASYAGPRTTMRPDHARASLDRHATYIVAAYVAGAAR
jgi:integrase